ncbi:GNAT family N-acetyltransferase [Solirhodobacter olei]|uniref:GNAT family N-acetyltransferase n=1 Tax=Solirhodobacter olei TaxID=2493082 RepID=UPI001F4D5802|nr:GNAT family N-acetyltransferase [Solirhodobacter olei]
MSIPEQMDGHRLRLRTVRLEDAEYIHGLRSDPAYNQHLSRVAGTAEDQRKWIESYKGRETVGLEAYYVIERLDNGQRCGLVRLYDIENDRFTWGSWILDANKPPKAALESAVLSLGVGFADLGRSLALIEARHDNLHATAFYLRFGMDLVGKDELSLYFEYPRSRFEADLATHLKAITGQ